MRMRTVEWDENTCQIRLIDQRLLPGRFELYHCKDIPSVIFSIQHMVVRGAPAIGAAAAFGMALAACQSKATTLPALQKELAATALELIDSRPTAVNLAWAVNRMLALVQQAAGSTDDLRRSMLNEAQAIADEDVRANLHMAELGANLINDGDTIIHHCNTGSLATVDWGTALGVIRRAHEQGKRLHILVDETRPRLQGARLTAWELEQYGIPYEIITDNAAGYFLRSGEVDKVLFGADRVAANGDVANKVGSYMLALAAHANGVPVYSVFPTTTLDLNLPSGELIPIEARDPAEVLDIQIHGQAVAPEGAQARNPAFDVTPHALITALVTDAGIVYPPFNLNLPLTLRGA